MAIQEGTAPSNSKQLGNGNNGNSSNNSLKGNGNSCSCHNDMIIVRYSVTIVKDGAM